MDTDGSDTGVSTGDNLGVTATSVVAVASDIVVSVVDILGGDDDDVLVTAGSDSRDPVSVGLVDGGSVGGDSGTHSFGNDPDGRTL